MIANDCVYLGTTVRLLSVQFNTDQVLFTYPAYCSYEILTTKMLFRRRSRSHESPVVQILGDCSLQLSPTKTRNIDSASTIQRTLNLPKTPATPPNHYRGGSSDESHGSAGSSPASSPRYRKEPTPQRVPTSRKTGFATIRTDSTDTQPAFESDAFAVLMPTTRLPILDRSQSPPKTTSPAARADALRTYQEKAQQIRERNNSQGIKVPSRIVSYDYAARNVASTSTTAHVETESPPPAGSFPVSPPLPQRRWGQADLETVINQEQMRAIRSLDTTTRTKPTAVNHKTSTSTSATSTYRIYRPDSTAGASRSPSSPSRLPPSITVRIKPNPRTPVPEGQQVQTEKVQMESMNHYYNRPSIESSHSSRASSPVKSMPNFTRHNSVEGDSIFGYKSKDFSGTVAGASPTTSGSEKEAAKSKDKDLESAKAKGKEKATPPMKSKTPEKPILKPSTNTPKRSLTSRWPWLRPSGPRITKPTTTPVVFTAPAVQPPAPRPMSGYVDPFERLASPPPPPKPALTTLHNAAPGPSAIHRKTPSKHASLSKPGAAAPASPTTGKFDTGFAQIKSLALVLLKFCFIVYAVVALWFVLDALREAIHTIGVPFRVVRWVGGWVWFWVCWVGGIVGAIVGRRG